MERLGGRGRARRGRVLVVTNERHVHKHDLRRARTNGAADGHARA
jgi:hypothetical protein